MYKSQFGIFVFLEFWHWDLFGIWILSFGIYLI